MPTIFLSIFFSDPLKPVHLPLHLIEKTKPSKISQALFIFYMQNILAAMPGRYTEPRDTRLETQNLAGFSGPVWDGNRKGVSVLVRNPEKTENVDTKEECGHNVTEDITRLEKVQHERCAISILRRSFILTLFLAATMESAVKEQQKTYEATHIATRDNIVGASQLC